VRYPTAIIAVSTVLLGASFAAAESKPPVEAVRRAQTIAPYVTEMTVLVGRVDVSAIDAKALQAFIVEAINGTDLDKPARNEILAQIPSIAMGAFIGGLQATLKQSGAREVYFTFDIPIMGDPKPQPVMIVPIGKDANVPVLTVLFLQETPKQRRGIPIPTAADERAVRRVGDVLLIGHWRQIVGLEDQVKSERPELVDAFAAAPGSHAEAIFTLSADQRRVMEEMMSSLPRRLDREPMTTVTHGALWASLALDVPPRTRLRLTVQSESAAAANRLRRFVDTMLDKIVEEDRDLRELFPDLKKLIAPALPQVRGDQLVVDFDHDALMQRVTPFLTRALVMGRKQAVRMQSHSQMRQIVQACINYSSSHKGQYPDSLEQLIEEKLLDAQALQNPRFPDRQVGYVYQKPDVNSRATGVNLSRIPILSESLEKWPGAASIAYADGHVVLFRDEEQYNEALKPVTEAPKKDD
jgi:prepilin-type processing-associated H-X9-DG protein